MVVDGIDVVEDPTGTVLVPAVELDVDDVVGGEVVDGDAILDEEHAAAIRQSPNRNATRVLRVVIMVVIRLIRDVGSGDRPRSATQTGVNSAVRCFTPWMKLDWSTSISPVASISGRRAKS